MRLPELAASTDSNVAAISIWRADARCVYSSYRAERGVGVRREAEPADGLLAASERLERKTARGRRARLVEGARAHVR